MMMNSVVSFLLSKNKGGGGGDGLDLLYNQIKNLETKKLDVIDFNNFKKDEYDILATNVSEVVDKIDIMEQPDIDIDFSNYFN